MEIEILKTNILNSYKKNNFIDFKQTYLEITDPEQIKNTITAIYGLLLNELQKEKTSFRYKNKETGQYEIIAEYRFPKTIKKNHTFHYFLKQVYLLSEKINFNWMFCSMNSYKLNFEKNFEQFKTDYAGAELVTFVNNELEELNKLIDQDNNLYFHGKLIEDDYCSFKQTYKIALQGRKTFLENKVNELQNRPTTTTTETNPHSNIFSNNGFELFSYILENHIAGIGQRGRYADISFYYWKMFNNKPQYIHQRPEVFRNWFCKNYNDNFEKIRTETNTQNKNRNNNFTTSLNWFKQTYKIQSVKRPITDF